ncbi:MAG: ABC transporter substrate-binding protein [Lautropia sp.]
MKRDTIEPGPQAGSSAHPIHDEGPTAPTASGPRHPVGGRRAFLKGAAAVSIVPAPLITRAQNGKTLKYVPSSNLTILDPVFTPAAVSITHGYCVFDTLYGVDSKFQPQPQMAEGATVSDDKREWTIKLREGLRFHDGEPVRAADCVASLARWSKKDTFGQTLGAAVDSWDAVDDRTIRIKLTRPFGQLLHAIGKPHSSPAMIMPERLAKTDPSKPVTEMIGSGPYRFLKDEYVSGDRVAYAKFDAYKPRSEKPDWTSGGKVAHFDRLEWHVIPDQATAAAALQAGEVDWVESVIPDLLPLLRANKDVEVMRRDPLGLMAVMRFNHQTAPFNNVKLRQAVLAAVEQEPYMLSVTDGEKDSWRQCLAMFPCGMPGVSEIGKDAMKPPRDLEKARALIKASGYAGEKVVIINPTDIASIHPHGVITADLLKKLGMNVELQDTDWGTVVQRRVSKKPVAEGGWSIALTNWPGISIANPATNATIRGQGAKGWWGWYDDPQIEKLTQEWLAATDDADAQRRFDAVHRRALEGVPVVPLGQFFGNTAHRKNVTGILQGSAAFFWNVRRA